MLGDPSTGRAQLDHTLDWGRTLMSAGCVGAAAAALSRAREHVSMRRQFGRPLSEQPVVQGQLAAIFTPYPGPPAWERLNREGRILSRKWPHYNDAFRPAKMTPQQLAEGYLRLWREFYADKSDWALRDLLPAHGGRDAGHGTPCCPRSAVAP